MKWIIDINVVCGKCLSSNKISVMKISFSLLWNYSAKYPKTSAKSVLWEPQDKAAALGKACGSCTEEGLDQGPAVCPGISSPKFSSLHFWSPWVFHGKVCHCAGILVPIQLYSLPFLLLIAMLFQFCSSCGGVREEEDKREHIFDYVLCWPLLFVTCESFRRLMCFCRTKSVVLHR